MPRSGVAEARRATARRPRREAEGRPRRDRTEFERHLREAESYQEEVARYREQVSRRRVSGPPQRASEGGLGSAPSRQAALAAVLGPDVDDAPRQTVTITGQGAEGYASRHGTRASTAQRHLHLRPHERSGFQPDRVAMWAVFLGMLLVVMAVATAHA